MRQRWHRQSSKWLLSLVILGGMAASLAALAKGIEPSSHHLVLYGGVLVVAVFNRLDSRRRGYEASLSLGQARATIKTGNGADDERGGAGGRPGKGGDDDQS
jgi:hypothetical protein